MKIKKIIAVVVGVIVSSTIATVNVCAESTNNCISEISSDMIASTLSTSSKTVTSSTKMSIYLNGGASGTSNNITFKFSNIPSTATITKIVINGGTVSSSGLGLAVPDKVYLESPDGTMYANSWGVGNKIEITDITHTTTNGTWKMYFTATNVSDSDYSMVSYSNAKITIYYRT